MVSMICHHFHRARSFRCWKLPGEKHVVALDGRGDHIAIRRQSMSSPAVARQGGRPLVIPMFRLGLPRRPTQRDRPRHGYNASRAPRLASTDQVKPRTTRESKYHLAPHREKSLAPGEGGITSLHVLAPSWTRLAATMLLCSLPSTGSAQHSAGQARIRHPASGVRNSLTPSDREHAAARPIRVRCI